MGQHAVSNGYGYTHAAHSIAHASHQSCHNVPKKTCSNVPKVTPKEEAVTVAYPVPEKKCEQAPISIPRVTCQNIEEQKCIKVPEPVARWCRWTSVQSALLLQHVG